MGSAENWSKTTDRSDKMEWSHEAPDISLKAEKTRSGDWVLKFSPGFWTNDKKIITTSSKKRVTSFAFDWRKSHTSAEDLYREAESIYEQPFKIGDWIRYGGKTWRHRESECKIMVRPSGSSYSVGVGDDSETGYRKLVGINHTKQEAYKVAKEIMRNEPYLRWNGSTVVDRDGERVWLKGYE